MILDRYIYPLDKIYSEAVGVLYPVCGAHHFVPPTPPTPEPQELVDFYWGVWADDDNRPNYFSTTLSFSEREINLSELPEGWYGKAITDYGEVVVNANDIVFGNALDIPHDDSDLTNLVNYTGEDQTLATSFEIYDANDNLLYYINSFHVEVVRTEVFNVENIVFTFDERKQYCWTIDFDITVSGYNWTYVDFNFTDRENDSSSFQITPSDIVNNHVHIENDSMLDYLPMSPNAEYIFISLYNDDTKVTEIEVNNNWTTNTPFGDMHIILNTQGPTGYHFNSEIQCTRAMTSDTKYSFNFYDENDNIFAYLPMNVDPQDNTKLILRGGDDGQFVDGSLQAGDSGVAITCSRNNTSSGVENTTTWSILGYLPGTINYYVTSDNQ